MGENEIHLIGCYFIIARKKILTDLVKTSQVHLLCYEVFILIHMRINIVQLGIGFIKKCQPPDCHYTNIPDLMSEHNLCCIEIIFNEGKEHQLLENKHMNTGMHIKRKHIYTTQCISSRLHTIQLPFFFFFL